MPIKIQSNLPAATILEKENIFVMTEKRASTQDIRPLKIAIVNLMPTKEATETQLLRLLGNTPLQIDISLVQMEKHVSRHTSGDHLDRFYIPSSEVFKNKYDGMIITGAPVEQMPFEDVDYWGDLCDIMDYAKENVFSTLYICWGAQAGLYHNFGIKKLPLEKKLFGVFPNHKLIQADSLLRGFDDQFPVPTSRHRQGARPYRACGKQLQRADRGQNQRQPRHLHDGSLGIRHRNAGKRILPRQGKKSAH